MNVQTPFAAHARNKYFERTLCAAENKISY